jgi:beta-glucosidase
LPPFADYSMNNRTYRFFKGEPLYPFGYGLSYSKFQYSGLRSSRTTGNETEIQARVRNVSKRDGDEVAQFYVGGKNAGNPELRGFQRIHLKAGESKLLRFVVKDAPGGGTVST